MERLTPDMNLDAACAFVDAVEHDADEMRAGVAEDVASGRCFPDGMMPDPAIDYFPSGSNRPAEIRGLFRACENIGVTAHQVSANAEAELHQLAGHMVKVFIDSGAFSEVDLEHGPPRVVAPISEKEWSARLALYARLAFSLRDQLYCVAPDQVAFQKETLERLERYARHMKLVRGLFAHVIVPIQKGALSMAEFDRRAEKILGFSYIRGIPLKKDATKPRDLSAFLRERKPRAIHFLGLGIYSKGYDQLVAACRRAHPAVLITCDSARIPAVVGWGKDGASPRAYTKYRADISAADETLDTDQVCEEATRRTFADESRGRELDARNAGWFDRELYGTWEESQRERGLPTQRPGEQSELPLEEVG